MSLTKIKSVVSRTYKRNPLLLKDKLHVWDIKIFPIFHVNVISRPGRRFKSQTKTSGVPHMVGVCTNVKIQVDPCPNNVCED